MDFKLASKNKQKKIAKLKEWREKAYHSAKIYKERTTRWHDHRIKLKDSSKETRSCSSTQKSSYSVKENCTTSGKVRTTSSTHRHTSGQTVSEAKSSIFFSSNTEANVKLEVCEVLNIMTESPNDKYLGLPALVGVDRSDCF